MVLQVSVQEYQGFNAASNKIDGLFTVTVDGKRILTVLTKDQSTASKWVKDVLHLHTNAKPSPASTYPADAIFVGLVAESESPFHGPKPHNPTDHCFELLTLCVGSHCLIMQLAGGKYNPSRHRGDRPFAESPKAVKEFFENPRVFVVATNMSKTSERLRARHGISICNPLDLNELGMKRNSALGAASFDELVITVMGKSHDVIRPPKVHWWPQAHFCEDSGWIYDGKAGRLTSEKLMFTSLDSHLCLKVCLELLASEGVSQSSKDGAAAEGSRSGKKKF